ncbi:MULTISPECIES: TIR domain-containing protein [Pseudomonas]|uniref:TIR domain-containing protein n=1 Tax=Pseudomonas TaxID=286 RepID=UPI001F380E5D|nr:MULTISPECIES: nucleotide-binding protein [Pseudomonas]UJW23285.1 nucleotide-binding protein [Pseudomonas juntendi]
MARAKPPASHNTSTQPVAQDFHRGIERLAERIKELEAFDLNSLRSGATPELQALEVSIKQTLVRCFGENSSTYKDLQSAAMLSWRPRFWMTDMPTPDYVGPMKENLQRSIALLVQGQRALKEDLADHEHRSATLPSAQVTEPEYSRQVFVVHGHDEGARETIARFLQKIGFEPIILHEQANQGRTVIEKVERYGDVGFAVVLLTPDDEGCAKGGVPVPRARQNVLLELGYFIGRLGRGRVCALKRGSVEIPSDYAGVVYESLEGNWKHALGRELEEAGYEIDWNKVMRP